MASSLWPLIWVDTPRAYNWSGVIGESLSYSTYAIPDPDFPARWSAENSSTDPNGVSYTPPLPTKPSVVQYSFVSSNMEAEYYNVNEDTGFNINVDNVNVFIPFESIKYTKGDEEFSAKYPQELKDNGFDYVHEYIPSSKEKEIKTITIKATADTGATLTGTFQFEILNDYDSAREDLSSLVNTSKDFLQGLVSGAGEVADDIGSRAENLATEVSLPIKNKFVEVENRAELFGANTETSSDSVDALIKKNKLDEVDAIVGNGEGLAQPSTTNTQSSDSSTTSIDEQIKNGTISDSFFENLKK